MADEALERLEQLDDDELDALIDLAQSRADQSITRRSALQAAGGLGIGSLLGAGGYLAGTDQASADTAAGNFGSHSDPDDGIFEVADLVNRSSAVPTPPSGFGSLGIVNGALTGTKSDGTRLDSKWDSVETGSIATELDAPTDVSASRDYNTTYQNTEDHDIFVNILLNANSGTVSAQLQVLDQATFDNGVRVDRIDYRSTSFGADDFFTITGRVPSGYYYELGQPSNSDNDATITEWFERGLIK